MVIRQGDLYWVTSDDPRGPEPACRHLHVVVQNNLFSQSKINTVVVRVLTSKTRGCPGQRIARRPGGKSPKAKRC
jgi:mRNA interferase MazF